MTAPKMPTEYKGVSKKGCGYTNTDPRAWTEQEIEWVKQLKNKGYSNAEIAESIDRTPISVSIKFKRLGKQNETYNQDHIQNKYETNLKFVELINPQSVIDAYCGTKQYYKDFGLKNYYTNDIDKNIAADEHKDAFVYLCELYSKGIKADIVDLDPFGSAFDSFDLSIKMAKKGLCITFGEIGHKRFKRLDYVSTHYRIEDMSQFTVNPMIDEVVRIGLRNKKKLTPVFIANYKTVSRVWFSVEKIKVTSQWQKES